MKYGMLSLISSGGHKITIEATDGKETIAKDKDVFVASVDMLVVGLGVFVARLLGRLRLGRLARASRGGPATGLGALRFQTLCPLCPSGASIHIGAPFNLY